MERRKNVEQVIKCFSRLVHEEGIKDLRLVLVGAQGLGYEGILNAIASFDIPRDSIVLTGYVADEDLAALYSGASGFIYLSLYEGFGLPPLEAMQCGTPVITSNTSSLPEVVGEAGIMVDPTDEDAICQSLLDVYRDAGLRAQMSRDSLDRARQFSWDRCVRETIAAYKTALG
jgi:glycosyltransferase involved in cell wall biosynthesis